MKTRLECHLLLVFPKLCPPWLCPPATCPGALPTEFLAVALWLEVLDSSFILVPSAWHSVGPESVLAFPACVWGRWAGGGAQGAVFL